MTGTITVLVVIAFSFLGIFTLRLVDNRALGALVTGHGMIACILGYVTTTLCFTVLVWYGALQTPFLLVPSFGAFTIVMSFGFLHLLYAPVLQIVDLFVLFAAMGFFCGLMYSQVYAYRSERYLPYAKTIYHAVPLFVLAAVVVATMALGIFPPSQVTWGLWTDLIVGVCIVAFASATGFLLGASCIDDRVKSWIQTVGSSKHAVYPPGVTQVAFQPLAEELWAGAVDAWPRDDMCSGGRLEIYGRAPSGSTVSL